MKGSEKTPKGIPVADGIVSDLHVYLNGRKVLAISPGGDLSFYDDPDTLVATMQALNYARRKLNRIGVPDGQKCA